MSAKKRDDYLPAYHSDRATDDNTSPMTILNFPSKDPQIPYNWSSRKKLFLTILVLNTVLNSTLSSSLPSNATSQLSLFFHVSPQSLIWLTSTYLLGYIFGPLFFGPLSETYGRRVVLIPAFFCFLLCTLGCALVSNWEGFVSLRLLAGTAASCPITVVAGVYADLFKDPVWRGRAIAGFIAGNTFGPVLGPLVSGFSARLSWRWPFWIALMWGGISFVLLLLLPETYGPVLLKRRAAKLRKGGKGNVYGEIELGEKGWRQMVTVTLVRPLHMLVFEPVVLWVCIYLAFTFGILYLFFEAYPIVFQGAYGMTPGISALAFIPIAIGAMLACGIFFCYDAFLIRAKKKNKHWAAIEENRRLPLACFGGPVFALSLFWLGWSTHPTIHPLIPMLAGLPFGIGLLLIWMPLLNYLTDLYASQAASAVAATGCTRSLLAVGLPFAATPMYDKLGVQWASSLLGFVSLGLAVVPFIFHRYGKRLREKSHGARVDERDVNDREREA